MGNYYFKDRDGCELDGHPLQGVSPLYVGSAVATDGAMMCDCPGRTKWADKEGRTAHVEIGGFACQRGSGKENVIITIDDFDGHTAVLVKAWYPRTEYNEEFWLIGPDGCAAIAKQTRNRGFAG